MNQAQTRFASCGGISPTPIRPPRTDRTLLPISSPFWERAIGFHPYPVSIEGATVDLGDKRRAPLSHLSHDLRVRVPENDHPERIWAIGPAAQFAFRFAAAIIVTVLHSAHVAEQIANS